MAGRTLMVDTGSRTTGSLLSAAQTDGILGRRRAFTIAELFAALLILLIVWFAGKILLLAFGGVLVAVFLCTLSKWLSSFTRLPYGWSLALVVVVIFGLVGLMFWLVGSRLAIQANEFTKAVPSALIQIKDYLSDYGWGKWILDQSPDWARAIAQGNFPSRISDVASSIIDLAISIVIMLFVGLYCAAEPEVYVNGLVRLVPLNKRVRAREVLDTLGYNLRWWLIGQIFAMVCVGLITGIGLWIVGAPLALTLGVLAAALEIVPNIGPLLWLVPAVLVSLTSGATVVMHIVTIYAVTHSIESYVLIPLVQRRSVWLPPTLSILAVVLLSLLAGFFGPARGRAPGLGGHAAGQDAVRRRPLGRPRSQSFRRTSALSARLSAINCWRCRSA